MKASQRSTQSGVSGGRDVADGGDDEDDGAPITTTFRTLRPEKPMTKRSDGDGGVSGIVSAAGDGLDTDTKDDNVGGDLRVSGPQQAQSHQQTYSPSSSISKLFGSCRPAEALDLDKMRGAATKLRIPTRTESAEFVKSLSLPERLRDVRDELNAKLGSCISTSQSGGDDGSGGKATPKSHAAQQPALSSSGGGRQGDALSSSNAQAVHRFSTAATTASVDDSSMVSQHTFDTKEERLEEEMQHLERMTSWNTLGTLNTFGTNNTRADDAATDDNINALGMLGLDDSQDRPVGDKGNNNIGAPKAPIVDDDGNEISSEMLMDLKARRERMAVATTGTDDSQRMEKTATRRRVVQFDYPPISSLRECPRHDPEDQNKLFFSEEELDELEEDRMACKMADDVEVVAVAAMAPSATSSDSKSSAWGRKKMTKRKARKLALSSSQRLKEGAGSSTLPSGSQMSGLANTFTNAATAHGADVDDNTAHGDGRSPTAATAAAGNDIGSPGENAIDNSGGSMLKGVQIYLRQRSTNEVTKRGKN